MGRLGEGIVVDVTNIKRSGDQGWIVAMKDNTWLFTMGPLFLSEVRLALTRTIYFCG